jgi:hypothetical protein
MMRSLPERNPPNLPPPAPYFPTQPTKFTSASSILSDTTHKIYLRQPHTFRHNPPNLPPPAPYFPTQPTKFTSASSILSDATHRIYLHQLHTFRRNRPNLPPPAPYFPTQPTKFTSARSILSLQLRNFYSLTSIIISFADTPVVSNTILSLLLLL